MDVSNLMQMAEQMRKQVSEAQQQAAAVRVTGEAGGGLVRVVMNGNHEVIEVRIDPKAVDTSELTLLEDLLRAACNQACVKVAEGLQARVQGLLGGLNLDIPGVDLSGLGLGDLPKKP